ncbi:hypothetical protein HQ560_13615 [bacterium]|nr:hypothetical protein [bacterium]
MARRHVALLTVLLAAATSRAGTNWTPRVRAVTDFLMAQQTKQGCIPDVPNGLRANVDGATANVLIGLAYSYRSTHSRTTRRALHTGIEWLASRMERSSGPWLGSWRAAYSTKPPHVALPTQPHPDAEDGRGSTATAALFVYAVAVTVDYTEDETLARKMRPYVRAAADFLLEKNLGDNGLFHAGWVREKGSAKWTLDPMQYATDQATAYLGLRAATWLLKSSRCQTAADRLARTAPKLLFDRTRGGFGLGLDPRGKRMPLHDNRDGYVTQGYLSWVFGPTDETRAAMKWLRARLGPDSTVRAKRTDTAHTDSVLAFCLGSARLRIYDAQRKQVLRLLRDAAVTQKGGIRAVLAPNAAIQNDLAAWLLPTWFGARPMPFRTGR